MAFEGEAAIYGKTEYVRPPRRGERRHTPDNVVLQLRDSLTRNSGNGQHRSVFQKRPPEKIPDILFDKTEPVGIDHIFFGEHDKAFPDAEQAAYFKVLPCLGHNALVRGDDQHDHVNASRTSHHILHEALMSRDVNDAQSVAISKIQPGKAQLNSDAALFLLAETIAVYAGKRTHERGLAMVDMSCSSENKRHCAPPDSPSGDRTPALPALLRKAFQPFLRFIDEIFGRGGPGRQSHTADVPEIHSPEFGR